MFVYVLSSRVFLVLYVTVYVLYVACYVFHVCLFWAHVSGRLTHCVPWFYINKLCVRPPQYAPSLQVDLWPFDLESGVRVTCNVGYPCANFSLPRPLCSRLRPMYATYVRQTDVRRASSLNASALRGGGIINFKLHLAWPADVYTGPHCSVSVVSVSAWRYTDCESRPSTCWQCLLTVTSECHTTALVSALSSQLALVYQVRIQQRIESQLM